MNEFRPELKIEEATFFILSLSLFSFFLTIFEDVLVSQGPGVPLARVESLSSGD